MLETLTYLNVLNPTLDTVKHQYLTNCFTMLDIMLSRNNCISLNFLDPIW